MFRSSYDHHQVYNSYHVHVLIVHRCFTVKTQWDPITFHGKTSMLNKNMYMIALVDLMMVIR